MVIATQITGFGPNGTASDAKYLMLAVRQVGRTIVGWLCSRVPTTAPPGSPGRSRRGSLGVGVRRGLCCSVRGVSR
jgi:hypothetical protein